jgi:hypothetical protein
MARIRVEELRMKREDLEETHEGSRDEHERLITTP